MVDLVSCSAKKTSNKAGLWHLEVELDQCDSNKEYKRYVEGLKAR